MGARSGCLRRYTKCGPRRPSIPRSWIGPFAKAAGIKCLFKSWDIRTSWVQRYWLIKIYFSPPFSRAKNLGELRFVPLRRSDFFKRWFMCRGVTVKKPAVHICYIHHPPRNLYGYATGSDLQKYWIVRVYAGIVNFFLRHYDFETAQKVDYFIANSKETARRVKKFYRRESTVIYPPIDIKAPARQCRAQRKNSAYFFLSVGRSTYSKRVDLTIWRVIGSNCH